MINICESENWELYLNTGYLYMLKNRKWGHNMFVIFTRNIVRNRNVGYSKTQDIGFCNSKCRKIGKYGVRYWEILEYFKKNK